MFIWFTLQKSRIMQDLGAIKHVVYGVDVLVFPLNLKTWLTGHGKNVIEHATADTRWMHLSKVNFDSPEDAKCNGFMYLDT